MIPIASEPLIVHQIRWLKHAGIKSIVINLHHLSDHIKSYLGNGRMFGIKIQYSDETDLLDTGGGIVQALPLLGDGPFVVLNGDIWTNYPFSRLSRLDVQFAHLILTPKPSPVEPGDFALNGQFVRRNRDASTHDYIYCGIAVIHSRFFNASPMGTFSLTRDLIFSRCNKNEVTGEIFDGTWMDIGTPERLKEVQQLNL